MMQTLAAIVFTLLATGVALFQFALVFGAPWGELTLGGRYRGALPLAVRVVPAATGVLMLGFAAIMLARAGLAFADFDKGAAQLAWFVVAYFGLGVAANAATKSVRERRVWLPVAVVMMAAGAVVAIG